MGKKMYANEVEDNGYHPGCISGFMYAIDYHHWNYNVKKMIKDKKYEGKRHVKGTINPQTRLILDDSNELQQFLDEDESRMLDNQKPKYTRLAKKRSLKARITGLIAKDAKQQNSAKHKRGSSPRLLLRTYSIHHREPSDHDLHEVCKDERQATFLPGSLDDGKRSMKVPNDPVRSDMRSMSNASQYQFEKKEDILETFKVNKDLYQEIVKNADYNRKTFLKTLQNLDTKVRLTKSGSFPTADLSGRRNFKPSKLEHKKNEIWISPGEEKFLDCTQVPELAVLKYKNHLRSKSCMSSYNIDCSMIDRSPSLNFQILNRELKKDDDEMVFPLRESQQSVEVEAREDKSRGSIGESPVDEFPGGCIPPASEKDNVGTNGEGVMNRSDETISTISNDFDQYFLSERVAIHSRSSSLTESLDRYNRLYEYSSRQEVKLHLSKSLKLRNEYDLPSGRQVSFRRIHTLSHHDFWYPFQNEEPRDAQYEDWTIKTVVENNSVVERDAQTEEICSPIPGVANDKETVDTSNTVENVANLRVNLIDEDIAEMDDLVEKVTNKTVEKRVTYTEEDTGYSEIGTESPTKSILDLNSGAFLDEASPAYFSEGLKNISNHIDQNNPPANLEQMASVVPLSLGVTNLENLEDVERDIMNFGHSEFHETDNEDLIYISGLLELSGIGWDTVSDATWHSHDQPVNPSVLEELETYWHAESEFSKEAVYGCSHHLLLFDLVNEELIQMHKRSFTYYPKALSSSCHIRPLQVGKQISDEVNDSISKLLNRKPERYQTLDHILSQDLKESDGWFNLQLESEFVALELEDMVFDELLKEVLCA